MVAGTLSTAAWRGSGHGWTAAAAVCVDVCLQGPDGALDKWKCARESHWALGTGQGWRVVSAASGPGVFQARWRTQAKVAGLRGLQAAGSHPNTTG